MPNKSKRKPPASKPGRSNKRGKKKTAATASRNLKQASAPAAVLDSAKLKSLYVTMLQCRTLSGKVADQDFGRCIDVAPGREALLAGAVAHALPEDTVIAGKNALLADLCRGTKLQALLAQLLSWASAPETSTLSRGISAPLALEQGMALAGEIKDKGKAVIVFCGEHSAAASSLQDALARAARDKLPLVCLIESTLSSLNVGQKQRNNNNSGQQDIHSHFPQIAVDGTDVVAVFRVAQEAVRRARGGHGPSLIQCVMPESERKARTKKNDPLTFMERYLRRRKLWSNEWRKSVVQDFSRELERVFTPLEPA